MIMNMVTDVHYIFWIDVQPDITGPGVDILAAYSPEANPSGHPTDTRSVNFNIVSGTSMSCPHVSGAVALLKSVHPDWSPAAIKSALMTTGTLISAHKKASCVWSFPL